MTTHDRALLRAQLERDEGLRLTPYVDTVGKVTIGIGRNLDDTGISPLEARFLLENDIDRAVRDLAAAFPWFATLDPVRQAVLVNMCVNMGIGNETRGLRSFRHTLAAIARGDYDDAAQRMLASKWRRQVGKRAERLAQQMATGQWGDDD